MKRNLSARRGERLMIILSARPNTTSSSATSGLKKLPITLLLTTFSLLGFLGAVAAQQASSPLYSGMQWRLLGPHRAGRVTTVAGIPGQPAIYYFGTPGGGLWKTTNGGRIWQPIFDSTHQAAIGALALAPSKPNIIYVGTGENLEGNGVYKSTDAGVTWSNIGLRETNSITSLIVDPNDPNTVIVGARGPFVPGDDRGIYKTTDGGKNWKKVFFKDGKTAIFDMCADPDDFRIIYATA